MYKSFASELTKLSYGANIHEETEKLVLPKNISPSVRTSILRGAVGSDTGIRDPWLPWTARIHALPGSQEPADINKYIKEKVDSAANSIAKGLVSEPGILRDANLARGLANYGEAQHVLIDRTAHYFKPQEQGTEATVARGILGVTKHVAPGYGGQIPSALEHSPEKFLAGLAKGKIDRRSSEIDQYDPKTSIEDQRVASDLKSLRDNFHTEVRRNLEKQDITPNDARIITKNLYKAEIKEPGQTIGHLLRDAGYVADETIRAAKVLRPVIQKMGAVKTATEKMKIIAVGPELGSGHISQAKNLAEAARRRGIDAEIIDYNQAFFPDKRKTVKETGKLYERISRNEHGAIPQFIIKGVQQAAGADREKVRRFGEENRDAAIIATWSAARHGLKTLDNPLYVYHVDQSLNPYDDPKLQAVSDLALGKAKNEIHVGEEATVRPYSKSNDTIPVKGVAVSRRVLDSKGTPDLLQKDHFNITVSGGGYGMDVPAAAARILEAKNLPENVRVHAVAGYGKKPYKDLLKLKKVYGDKLVPYSYAPLPDMMRSADLNVVRGHGTSIGEAQTSGKPAVYFAGDDWNFQNVLTRNNVVQTGENYNIPVASKVQDIPAAVDKAIQNYGKYQRQAQGIQKRVGDAADEAVVKIMKDYKKRQ